MLINEKRENLIRVMLNNYTNYLFGISNNDIETLIKEHKFTLDGNEVFIKNKIEVTV
jgi:hypothetical protein